MAGCSLQGTFDLILKSCCNSITGSKERAQGGVCSRESLKQEKSFSIVIIGMQFDFRHSVDSPQTTV